MDDFGHSIGLPPNAAPSPGSGPASRGGHHPASHHPYGDHTYGDRGAAQAYGDQAPQPTAQPDADLQAAHAQARARAEAGDLTGARTMLEEALSAAELRLGRDDAALVPLMVDLATLARRLGNLTEAGNQLRRAYGVAMVTGGPQHPTSLSIEGRLAAVLYRLGEPTEAYDWHLADAGRRVLGDDHPAVRGAQQRLAAVAQTPAAPVFAPTAASAPTPPPAPTPAPRPAPASAPIAAETVAVPYAPPPPPAEYAPASPPERPATGGYGTTIEGDIWETGEATVRVRRPGNAGVVLVASLGTVILVVAVVVALALLRPSEPAPPQAGETSSPVTPSPAPTAAPTSPAPTGVRIVDDAGGTVTLAWVDPSEGVAPFVVSGAREGHAPVAIVTVPAGETTTTIYGLNVNFNYCFTVAAVWSGDLIQESSRTCTARVNVSASPS